MKIGSAFVGRIDGLPVNGVGSKTVLEFPSQEVAEDWITARQLTDPEGVKNGAYYIDVVVDGEAEA